VIEFDVESSGDITGGRDVCLPGVCVHWHGLLTISAD